MAREQWGSKLGFILAVAGSAVGLANIWRFPYIAGHYGGAAFVMLYLVCLFAIGFPTFIAEIVIGRRTHRNPAQAFQQLGHSSLWGKIGGMTIVTGFLVSAFYSAVAGWISGYFVEAISGSLISFSSHEETKAHYEALTQNPLWGVGFHFLFITACSAVLYYGIKGGIERWNKVFMPLLFLILFALVFYGLQMTGSGEGLSFLFSPNWSALNKEALIVALGQSFFTLSIGQGTLVTYGSYLSKNEKILSSGLPIVFVDTLVSLLSAVAIFTIVFSVGISPDSGPALLFHTLPLVFSQIPAGYLVSILFFLLVLLAALTSEISALEPSITYLCDQRGWKRHKAVIAVGIASFLVGVPCALSTSLLKDVSFLSFPNVLEAMIYLCSNVLIPLGGLAAVILIGWRWGIKNFFQEIHEESTGSGFVKAYFYATLLVVSPILIIIVFLNEIGFFG